MRSFSISSSREKVLWAMEVGSVDLATAAASWTSTRSRSSSSALGVPSDISGARTTTELELAWRESLFSLPPARGGRDC